MRRGMNAIHQFGRHVIRIVYKMHPTGTAQDDAVDIIFAQRWADSVHNLPHCRVTIVFKGMNRDTACPDTNKVRVRPIGANILRQNRERDRQSGDDRKLPSIKQRDAVRGLANVQNRTNRQFTGRHQPRVVKAADDDRLGARFTRLFDQFKQGRDCCIAVLFPLYRRRQW